MSLFNTSHFERQGNTGNDQHLETTEAICDAIINLSETTLRTIKIFTPNLESQIYNNETLRQNILNFVRGNRHAQVQILVADLTEAINHGHILLQLANQITSAMKIKIIPDDYIGTDISFITFDQSNFIFKADSSKHDALQSSCKNRSLKLTDFFTHAWEQARHSPLTQQLHIYSTTPN